MSVAVFDTIESVQLWLADKRVSQQRVAFVPTMGALHPGHVSLIKQARQMADVVVSSIFVNPTQFNNPADLLKYPRTLDADIAMLEEAGCDVVFTPDVAEIYPTISKSHWDFGLLSSRLEGQFRPGHFDGVCTVVKRLFEIVQPNLALFGEKDFQQLAIIRKLVEYEGMPIEILGCRTMREADGLAMSSRNLRLTTKQRQQARAISQTLFWMQQNRHAMTPAELTTEAKKILDNAPGLRTEYLQIVDGNNFEDIEQWSAQLPVALYAGYCGEVRLIDNVML